MPEDQRVCRRETLYAELEGREVFVRFEKDEYSVDGLDSDCEGAQMGCVAEYSVVQAM